MSASILAFPTVPHRRVRSGRLNYKKPPPNVHLHPTLAASRARSYEPPPPVVGETPESAVLLALIATLDRQARDGGSPRVMLDLLQATHRFSSPEVERPATALVSRLWDQLAIEAAERRYRAGEKEACHEPS